MSSLIVTANESSPNASPMESCPSRPSLAMSEHSLVKGTPQHIRDWLMSLQPDSRVSPFPLQESKLAPTILAICGPQQLSASASYDRTTRSWRTFQASFLLDTLEPYSETWPKAGMTQDGAFYRQPKWERRISEIGFGLWLTPAVGMVRGEHYTPETSFRHWTEGRQVHLSQQVRDARMWPTPNANDGSGGKMPSQEALCRSSDGTGRKVQISLNYAVKTWATPQSRDYRTGSAKRWEEARKGERSCNLNNQAGGSLNPNWVDWLMGFPIGWTDLKPLEMDKYRLWLEQHGIY